MLPAALLVVLWWKRGRLDAKRDVLPLAPWLAAGAAAGLFTAWVERRYVHATGPEFNLSFTDRLLLAGRLPWQYLEHILWPVNLSFLYRRFLVDAHDPIDYLYLAATLLAMAMCALELKKGRSALAAALLFVGVLFPVLGFFNVYPFRYSWVADHFGYLASLAVIVPVCALLTRYAGRYATPLSAALLALLGWLSWSQSHNYSDSETLWEATIASTPSAWMAHYNLAVEWAHDPARRNAAIAELRAAIRYKPDLAAAHADLADRLQSDPQDLEQAFSEYQKALSLDPLHATTHYSYGMALAQAPSRQQDAIAELEQATRLNPALFAARYNLASMLTRVPGRMPEAIAEFRALVRDRPEDAEAHYGLALALYKAQSPPEEAIGEFEAALRINPGMAAAHSGLAVVLAGMPGRLREAIAHLETAQRLEPDSPEVNQMLARGAGDAAVKRPPLLENL